MYSHVPCGAGVGSVGVAVLGMAQLLGTRGEQHRGKSWAWQKVWSQTVLACVRSARHFVSGKMARLGVEEALGTQTALCRHIGDNTAFLSSAELRQRLRSGKQLRQWSWGETDSGPLPGHTGISEP